MLLDDICVGSDSTHRLQRNLGLTPYFVIINLSWWPLSFLTYFDLKCSHILFFTLFSPSSSLSPFFVSQSLYRQDKGKLLRKARLFMGCTKLDPRSCRGPEGKPTNYSCPPYHGVSCCLSPSICGHRKSADRPVCFYLPCISIQGDEACQGFTGTGNVSLAPGVSVV